MIGPIFTRIAILLFGVAYPAYASYKAVKTKNSKEYSKWMMYWIVFAFYTIIESLADVFLTWAPFYHEGKLVLIFWFLSPVTKGASIAYRKFIHPHLLKHEEQIDSWIAMLSKEGHNAIWQFGGKLVTYLAEILLLISNRVNRGSLKGGLSDADSIKDYDIVDADDATAAGTPTGAADGFLDAASVDGEKVQ